MKMASIARRWLVFFSLGLAGVVAGAGASETQGGTRSVPTELSSTQETRSAVSRRPPRSIPSTPTRSQGFEEPISDLDRYSRHPQHRQNLSKAHVDCDLQALANEPTSALLAHVRSASINCIGGLFKTADVSIRSRVFRMENMLAMFEGAEARAASYEPPDEVMQKYFIFLRAGYFHNYNSPDDIDWSDSANRAQVDDAAVSALTTFADNQHFYAVSNEHAAVLKEFFGLTDGAELHSQFHGIYKRHLQDFNRDYLQYAATARAFRAVISALGRGAHNVVDYRVVLLEDLELVDVLRDVALADWAVGTFLEAVLTDAAFELSLLLSYDEATIYPGVASAVQDVLNRYGYTGEGASVGLAVLRNIIAREKCEEFSVCDAVDRLKADVLPITHECEGVSVVIRAQDLTARELRRSCSKLAVQEGHFHELLSTQRTPVADDYNETLEFIIYADSKTYVTYSAVLFGNGTNNGGLYLEGDPSDVSNEPRAFVYRESHYIRNFEHEHVHYLDGRFNMQGAFDDYRTTTHSTLFWAEGLAEYVSRKGRVLWAYLDLSRPPALSEIFRADESSGSAFLYGWGYMATRYLFESRRDEVSALLSYLRAGEYDDYLRYVRDDIGETYDREFAEWLTSFSCPAWATFTAYTHISRVSLGTMDNATGSNGYGEEEARARIDVRSRQTLAVVVDVIFAVRGDGGDESAVNAWVDWNEDLVFDDSERILSETITMSDQPVEVSQSFAVPNDVSGVRRMRVKVGHDLSDSRRNDACGGFERGEVEDYEIEIADFPGRPEGLVVVPGDGRATLRWSDPSDRYITGYAVRYATDLGALDGAAAQVWSAVAGSEARTVEHVVEGLANGERYHFELRAARGAENGPSARASVQLAASPSAPVVLDAALGAVVARALDKREAQVVTQLDMTRLRELEAGSAGVADLAGLERAVNLESLDLSGNAVADLAPLSTLSALRRLRLVGSGLRDVSALSGLSALEELWLNDNSVSDLSPLAGLASLKRLEVARNQVRDLPALDGLSALERLRLDGNRVTDAAALAESDLRRGSVVGLRGNPLSAESIEDHLPALREAGVTVLAGWPVPLFPAAADAARQGFVRVVNRSDVGGAVMIEAMDDAGGRRGLARLVVGAGEVSYFNSDDLEAGAEAKGLAGGVGAPTAGGWRLALVSALDIEVLSYMRTPDGFLTSAHDTLRRDERAGTLLAPVFNPGSNQRQRSSLRLMNPGGVAERVSVSAVDDAGTRRLAAGLSVPARSSLTVTAAELEAGGFGGAEGGLGDGQGKWRLAVEAPWPVQAASLLESPGGHLTNLSTIPVPLRDGVWRAPFFPAESTWRDSGWQGFARVVNRSARAGEVSVAAVDDAGVRAGPRRLMLDAGRTVHFNSGDLERGNAAKGLPDGVGAPTRGDWRLELASDLDIEVSSYIRTRDGFLTSMHDVAPTAAAGARRVVIFNPGSNERQVSLLRLINDGGTPASVAVTGLDDAGRSGGEVGLVVAAGQARTVTAAELESGGDDFDGALGNGTGKWQLSVASDTPVQVVSLLRSATGHLSNLSSAPQP